MKPDTIDLKGSLQFLPKINNLDALDIVVVPNLIQLGRRHAQIVGFKVDYLDAFTTSMTDVWEAELGRERFVGSTQSAWSTLFLLITNSVLDGYQQRSSEIQFTKPSLDDVGDSPDLDLSSELREFDSETA